MSVERKPDDQRGGAVAGRSALPDCPEECEEEKGSQRGDEELPVVPGTHLGGEYPGELVGEAAGDRRDPREPEPSQQRVHRAPREDQMAPEGQVGGEIERQEPAEPRRRIEDVAVHPAHVRQPAEYVWVPERNRMVLAPVLRPEVPERPARQIVVGSDDDLGGEDRPVERERRRHEHREGDHPPATRLHGSTGFRRGHALPP